MRKNLFEAALFIALAFSLITSSLALDTQRDISDKLIRLHVIANSDSDEDQSLKLLVRDEVLSYVSMLTKNCSDIEEARKMISANLIKLEEIAQDVIVSKGFSYTACAELSEVYFPTKVYDDFSLPAGKYESLRIKLGNAAGKNWWCVLFPPVCISAAEAESEFKNAGLSDDEINFVMSDKVEYRFRFKIVEIIENIAEKI